MDEVIKEHKVQFGKAPNIIGMFWHDQEKLIDKIWDAIDNDEPYDEYEMLTTEQKLDFDAGNLVF